MTRPSAAHPLTDAEIEVYNTCSRTWSDPCFGYGSLKTVPLSDELKRRLGNLASICAVQVTFQIIDAQHYIFAVRSRTK